MICHIPQHTSRRRAPVCTERPCMSGCDPERCPLARTCPHATSLALGPGRPGAQVCVFEPDWDRVDEARMQADAAGIADRVSVHHADALEWCRPSR